MSRNNCATEEAVYEAARAGDLALVKELMGPGSAGANSKLNPQMAVMGAADGKQAEVGFWALQHGGCLFWSFKQEAGQGRRCVSMSGYGKNISMLKGPGEVARGTFATKKPE